LFFVYSRFPVILRHLSKIAYAWHPHFSSLSCLIISMLFLQSIILKFYYTYQVIYLLYSLLWRQRAIMFNASLQRHPHVRNVAFWQQLWFDYQWIFKINILLIKNMLMLTFYRQGQLQVPNVRRILQETELLKRLHTLSITFHLPCLHCFQKLINVGLRGADIGTQ